MVGERMDMGYPVVPRLPFVSYGLPSPFNQHHGQSSQ